MNLERQSDFVEVSGPVHAEAFCKDRLDDPSVAIYIVLGYPVVELDFKEGASVQQLTATFALLPARREDDLISIVSHRIAPCWLDHHAGLFASAHVLNGSPEAVVDLRIA